MKNFRLKQILFIFYFSLFTIISGCDSSSDIPKENKLCPKCNMPLSEDNSYTAYIEESNYFDDIGCLILWSKDNRIDLDSFNIFVFSNDTKKYIDAKKAHYTIDDMNTPMNYGFAAYEKPKDKTINFKEMQLRMLRGEYLANPKIRKKILGE